VRPSDEPATTVSHLTGSQVAFRKERNASAILAATIAGTLQHPATGQPMKHNQISEPFSNHLFLPHVPQTVRDSCRAKASTGRRSSLGRPYRFREVRRYRCQARRAKTNAATEVSNQSKPEIRAVMVVGRCGPPVWKNAKPEIKAPIIVRAHHPRQVTVHRPTSLNVLTNSRPRTQAGFRKVTELALGRAWVTASTHKHHVITALAVMGPPSGIPWRDRLGGGFPSSSRR
jgi:hypothetical protein